MEECHYGRWTLVDSGGLWWAGLKGQRLFTVWQQWVITRSAPLPAAPPPTTTTTTAFNYNNNSQRCRFVCRPHGLRWKMTCVNVS